MSIASRIEAIEEHIGDIYETLELGGADLTNVNKNILNVKDQLKDRYLDYMNNGTETIWNNWEKVTGEGTSLSLSPTLQAPMKNILKGNTSQTGTPTPSSPIPVNVVSGDNEIQVNNKNRITFDNLSNRTWGGVDVSYNNSEIKMNGTTTGDGQIIPLGSDLNITLPAGTYTISYKFGSGTASKSPGQDIAFYLRDSSTNLATVTLGQIIPYNGYSATFTINETKNLLYYAYCNASGISLNNLVIQVQIEEGSSVTNFEPYQGNTYNIDLPVENLFNKNGNLMLDYRLASDGGNYRDIGYYISEYIPISANTTYTKNSPTADYAHRVCFFSSNDTTGFISKSEDNTFTTPNNAKYLRFCGLQTEIDTTQLEVGSKQNNFTPYGTTPIELCKIGNYQDYIYKDSDKWYLHKEIGKYIFGSTNLAYDSTYNRAYTNVSSIINNILIPTSNSEALNGLSDYFSILNATTFLGNTSLKGLAISSTGTLSLRNTSYTTQTDYNNWLSTNKPILYYALATPTNTEITYGPLIYQLEAWYQARSKNGQTNISQINNDLPFIINSTMLKEE